MRRSLPLNPQKAEFFHILINIIMNNFFSYLRLLLLATSGMLLLCIIFAMNPELADGTLSGKICWFHFTSLLLAGGVLLMEFTTKKSRFIFSLPDALLLLLFGIVLVSYDKDENLQPERFLFIAQLVALWFMLRGALHCLLYTSPSPRDISGSRMPSSA